MTTTARADRPTGRTRWHGGCERVTGAAGGPAGAVAAGGRRPA